MSRRGRRAARAPTRRHRRADAQHALRRGPVAGDALGLAQQGGDLIGIGQELLADAGQCDALLRAVEQRRAELQLQRTDVLGDVRLYRVERQRRAPDRPGAGHGGEEGEIGAVHSHAIFYRDVCDRHKSRSP